MDIGVDDNGRASSAPSKDSRASSEARASEARASEGRASEARASEGRVSDAGASQAAASGTSASDARSSGKQPGPPPSTEGATASLPPVPHPAHVAHGPVFIVVNAGSGRESRERKLAPLKDELERSGRAGELLVATDGSQITELASQAARRAEREGGIVVVAGGDGTVSAVARAVVPLGVALGVVPEGTFNLLGRNHGLSEEPAEAMRTALTGQAIPVQVGRLNDLLFLVNASIGLYPKVLADREELKMRFGRRRWVALLALMKTLLGEFRPLDVELVIDGLSRRMRTPTLFVGNNRLQLDRLGLSEAGATDRGQLVLLSSPPLGGWTLFKLLVKAAIGRLDHAEEMEVTAFKSLEVQRAGKSARRKHFGVAIDGERFRIDAPAHFSVETRPLWLIMPMAAERTPEADAQAALTTAEAEAGAPGPSLGGLAGA